MTFPDYNYGCMSAVELMGSRRPVGKRWETRSVFHGLSIGNRICAVRREPAQPAVHKSIVQGAFHLSGRRRQIFGRTSEIGFVRRFPVERLMWSPSVVPVKEFDQAPLLFDTIRRRSKIDPLVLHRPPQALNKDIVVVAPAAIHADLDLVLLEDGGEFLRGELAALVAVEDLGFAVFGNGLLECFNAKVCRHRVRQPPGQYPPSGPVHDRHQVQETLLHRDVTDVGGPHLVRPIDGHAPQQVGINLVLGMRAAGVRFRRDCPQAQLLHQPAYAPTSDQNTFTLEGYLQPPATVYRILGEYLVQTLEQVEFLSRVGLRVVIDAAARNSEQFGLPGNGQFPRLA